MHCAICDREMETTYTIFRQVAYEGPYQVFCGTLEQVKEYIKSSKNIDELDIYSNDAPDVYELYGSNGES